MSPAHFRLFAEVDSNPDHDWNKLADDTYVIINNLKRQYQTPLIKNWYVVNQNSDQYLDAAPYVGESANYFSYDAFRIFWRLWLDYAWNNNKSAENYLGQVGNYMDRNFSGNSAPTIINPVSGEVISYQPSLAILSSYIFPLTFADDSDAAFKHYTTVLASEYSNEGYWGYKDIYYDQNWAWFHSALYNNDVYNIWTFYDEN
jgi:endoglucanase